MDDLKITLVFSFLFRENYIWIFRWKFADRKKKNTKQNKIVQTIEFSNDGSHKSIINTLQFGFVQFVFWIRCCCCSILRHTQTIKWKNAHTHSQYMLSDEIARERKKETERK